MKEFLLTLVFALIVVGLTVYAILSTITDEQEWKDFKATYSCHVVAQKEGETPLGVVKDFKGGTSVLTTTSDKTAWLCSDGVTYWKDKAQ